jgi:hypothetical protein
MVWGSVATALGERNVASLAAIGTVIEAVGAQVHVTLPLANGAVFVAVAEFLGFVALLADGWTLHETPPGRMYLRKCGGGKERGCEVRR